MNAFFGERIYEEFKDCYVDLESESSDEMLYKCAGKVSKKVNNLLETKENIEEGFTSNCCPDGTTNVGNSCVRICNNCKYNDCNYGSSNIGGIFSQKNTVSGKKELDNLKNNENIFNYIFIDVQ